MAVVRELFSSTMENAVYLIFQLIILIFGTGKDVGAKILAAVFWSFVLAGVWCASSDLINAAWGFACAAALTLIWAGLRTK